MRTPTLLLVCALLQLAVVPHHAGSSSRSARTSPATRAGTTTRTASSGPRCRRSSRTSAGDGRATPAAARARSAGASRTRGVQAYYAMPLGRPLTFDDELSASGKLVLRHIGLRGVGYVGFFNSRRHTWRVWNSMAFRVWEEDDLGQVMFDWMSSDWQARGAETAILLPADGKVHTWSFRYEPEAQGRPDLARRGPRAAHHRPHGERPALRAPGRGAPVRAAEEGGARPDARGAARAGC